MKEGYQVRPVAEKEAKRGTSDPTYLVYTLGKLEILKLREDYKKMKGAQFTLEGFHDAFLRQGTPPIKIVRQGAAGERFAGLVRGGEARSRPRLWPGGTTARFGRAIVRRGASGAKKLMFDTMPGGLFK